MRPFRNLRVWRRALQFAEDVYRLTNRFPDEERYGLTSQVRRAANSIGANIAEGAGRDTPRDFIRFLRYAFGSANEAEHHLLLAHHLGYLSVPDHQRTQRDVTDLRRMLTGLIRQVNG